MIMDSCDRCNSLMEPARLDNYQGEVEQCNGCGMIRIYIKEKPRHRHGRRYEWHEIDETEEAKNYNAEKEFYEHIIYQAFKGAPKFARGGWVYKDGNL